ncbi:MAG: Uma2 family endonuclease, partial [Clostridiales bacterium]|nr:Uma2 family endonuclease [Clostridiales bacterium]
MGAALKLEGTYTVDYIYNLPDGQRAELIDGVVYDMASPSRTHQKILGDLFFTISNHIRSKGGDCEPYMAPFAVLLNKNDRTYVEPDISVICDPSKLDDKGCNGAPDWITEIASPSSRHRDYVIKVFKYRAAGVREYWIVDAELNQILKYEFAEDPADDICKTYTLSDTVPAGICPDFSIDFK